LAADHLAAENTDSSVMPKSKDTHDKAAGTAPPVPYLANALTLFARHLGVEVTTDSFLRGLPISGHDLDETLVSRAMDKIGLVCSAHVIKSINNSHLPCCVELGDNRYAVIIDMTDTHYVIATSKDGGYKKISCDIINKRFAGKIYTALISLDNIERRHIGEPRTGHWFWGRFRDHKEIFRDIVVGTLFANLLAVSISLFTLQVYDRVIPHQSFSTLWVLVIGAMLAISLEAVLKIARSRLMDVSGRRIEIDISAFLFEKLQGMKLSSRPTTPNSLLYAMREFSSVREFFTAASVGSIADIPFVLIFLALIYAIAGNVVFLIMFAMILIVLPSLLSQKKMSALSEEMLGGASAANKVLAETAYGHESIKTHRGESIFQRRWEEITTLNAEKTTQQRDLSARLTFFSQAIQQTAYILAIVAGVYLVFTGEFTVGAIIAISILTTRTLSPVTHFAATLARWQQVKIALQGLESIAHSEQERPAEKKFARRANLIGNIDLNKTQFRYADDDALALNVDRLIIEEGEILGVLGVNGSGKSSLLKVLSGLYEPTAGNIIVDGVDLRQIDPHDIRRNIGYLPQEVKLFSGTLWENLTYGALKWSEKEVYDALKFSGLSQIVRSHALGLELEIRDGGEGLSMGQRQSVGLARLFLQDPSVVLMDEPTSSLDQGLELRIINQLTQWLAGKTCIFTTHRPNMLNITSRVIVMNEGRIAMNGSREEVISKLQVDALKVVERNDA